MTRRPLSYTLLTGWARSAVKVFYRRVDVEGRENLTAGRPTILAANHSNALGDVAVIVAKVPDFPHFLAAATWWKRRSARILFGLGGVLPVQRRGDGPGPHDNDQTFAACFRALEQRAHLAIFPEGVMHLDPTPRPLKTGAARIGLGAADVGVPGVTIVPVGLVYEDRGRFRSDATVRFGRPIVIDDWIGCYEDDAFAAVNGVTKQLADELARVTRPLPPADEPDRATRSRAVRDLVLLSPAAAFGLVANAPVFIGGLLARGVKDEMWHASIKGVGGTVLVPATWGATLAVLARRHGFERALVLTTASAVGGLATLAWIDRRRDLA